MSKLIPLRSKLNFYFLISIRQGIFIFRFLAFGPIHKDSPRKFCVELICEENEIVEREQMVHMFYVHFIPNFDSYLYRPYALFF